MNILDLPQRVVTDWQDAFDGGWRIPVTCVLPFMAEATYWFPLTRAWNDDKDWNMEETARN